MTQMTKTIALATVAGCLFASGASAGPLLLSDTEMDSVVAGSTSVTFTDAFVCPVITTAAVTNGPGMPISDGDYTIVGPDHLYIPDNATTRGSPAGDHAKPGDTDYTAIWAGNP